MEIVSWLGREKKLYYATPEEKADVWPCLSWYTEEPTS